MGMRRSGRGAVGPLVGALGILGFSSLAVADEPAVSPVEKPASGSDAEAGQRQMIELLVAGLTDPKPFVRHLTVQQLSGPEHPPHLVAAVLGKAVREADERTAPSTVRTYVELLHQKGSQAVGASDALLMQLQPGSPLLRNTANSARFQGYLFATLARVGAPTRALPLVLQGLQSSSPTVYAGAASVAGALGPSAGAAVPFLMRALAPPFQDTPLDSLFEPILPGSVTRVGHGGATTTRREALQALGKIGRAAAPAIPLIRQIAQMPAKDARSREQALTAIKALEEMGDVARSAFLEEWARLSKGAQVRINQPVPSFSFADLRGKNHALQEWRGQLALFVFVDTQCPCVAAYDGRIQALHEKYQKQGLQVVYVYANPDDDLHAIEHAIAKRNYPWVTMQDASQKLTRLFNAQVASETCLLDRNGVLRYRGRVDDSIYDLKAVKEHNLEDAIRALLNQRPVAKPETTAFGCAFPRPDES